MTVMVQDPNFDDMGHDFRLDPSIPPHGQHACTRCRIQAASFTHYPAPCPGDQAHSRACSINAHDHGPACHRNCPTCGGGFGVDPVALPSLDDTAVESLTDAESLGVLVAGALHQREIERDKARAMAVEMEQQLAQAVLHLGRVLAILGQQGTTFATDSRSVSQANEFLEGLGSDQTPTEGPST